jgi:hypothetical protein
MMISWRLPACAAFCLCAVAATASAQTVWVRHAPAGRSIDVVVGRTDAGKGTADENGDAKIPISLQAAGGTAAMDANVFVDVCENLTRILVESGGTTPPAPDVGCERRDVQGLYAVKAESSLVVSVGGAVPSMLLIQGGYTPPKPSEENPDGSDENRPRRPASTGLALYAAGSMTSIRDAAANACGANADCKPDGSGPGYSVGGVVWLTKWLGAEAGYLRPAQVRASQTTDPLHFDMRMKTDIVIVAGKIAIPAGPARIYGTFGADYHQATQDTSETLLDRTATATDGSTVTLPGGTQTFHLETKGWSYVYGGGGEVWLSRPLALFGELNVINLKGDPVGGGDFGIKDRLTSINFGFRIRIGGSAKPGS